jgi:hypothetical protein
VAKPGAIVAPYSFNVSAGIVIIGSLALRQMGARAPRHEHAQEFSHSLDPLLPFHIGPMNGRGALESGRRLKG